MSLNRRSFIIVPILSLSYLCSGGYLVSSTLQWAGIILIIIVVVLSIIGLMVEKIDTPKITVIGAVVAGFIFKFMTDWDLLLEANSIREEIPNNFLEALAQMIDVDVILIIFSVSVIVSVTKKSGFFDLISLAIVKRTKGDPKKLMISLGGFSFLLSMFFDNLSAIIILGSLTVIVCKELDLRPQPYVLFVGTNTIIGGLPTPVSSLPNLIFYKSFLNLLESNPSYEAVANINFLKFTLIMFPAALIFFAVAVVYFFLLYRKELFISIPEEKIEQIKRINIWTSVKKKTDVYKSVALIVILFTGFILSDLIGIGMGFIALFVAMLALVLFNDNLVEFIKEGIEWEMIVYYAGLFVLMGIFIGVGSLQPINTTLSDMIGVGATTGTLILVALIVGLIGLPVAGFLDASSAAILFSQIFGKIVSNIGMQNLGLWFAFVFAGNMGGSLSPIGSITILIAIKVLNREGDDITFMQYVKKTLGLTIIHALLAIVYSFVLIAIFA